MALSCHHIFCSDCLKQCYRKKRQEKVGSIKCPDCNHLTQVPNNWVAALPITISNGNKHGNNKAPYFAIIMFVALVSVLYVAIPHNFTVLDHKQSSAHVKTGFQGETDAHCHALDDQLQRSQSGIQEIEPKKQTIQNDKDSVTKSLVAFIQFAKLQLDQCEQQVTDAISQHHGAQDSKLLGKQWPVLNERLHSIGQAYFKSILPSRVAFRNEEITAGLDLLWEYWIQHGANGPLYVTSCYSTWIFCRGVSGFATDCPCDVWCRGLTTCLLHVGPPFGNRILNNSWAVGLT